MKILNTALFALIFFSICFGQSSSSNYVGEYEEFFFSHEPSTSAEATGKLFMNNNNDAFSSVYNPANPSLSDKVRFSYSGSQRYYYLENAFYNNLGIDIPVKGVGTFSLVRRYYNVGEDIPITTISNPDGDGSAIRLRDLSYNINFSHEVMQGLSAGAGINYFTSYMGQKFDYYSLNLGINYSYTISSSEIITNSAFINTAFMDILSYSPNNISGFTYDSKSYQVELPIPKLNHLSFGYIADYNGLRILKDSKDIQVDVEGGLSWLFNSRYFRTSSVGVEVKLLELLSLRCGYYKFDDYGVGIEEFTYGAGINYPIGKFLPVPISVGLDYTRLRQPGYEPSPYYVLKYDHFNSLSFNLSYNLN